MIHKFENLVEMIVTELLKEATVGNFHLSDLEISVKDLESKKQSSKPRPKPQGFWYSCGDDWLVWKISEESEDIGKYYYKVNLDYSNILKISDIETLQKFTEKYATGPDFDPNSLIDWELIAKTYSGIEICPHFRIVRSKMSWYGGWDVASGCIWDVAAIKSLELVNVPEHEAAWNNSSNIDNEYNMDEDDLYEINLNEEVIGTSGGVRYYQLGGSLPDHLYNKTNDGKPTRDPGVPGIKKSSRKRGKMEKSSEDKPGKKEKRWYEKEAIRYKSFKTIFAENNNEDILVEYPGDPEKENTPSRGIDGEFPFLNQVFYHGSNKEFGIGDYIQPPSITGNVSEKGRKKNLDKIFFTMDAGSARIYAGRAVQSFGVGSPHVYKVQPIGEVEWINKTPGTTVLMAPQAKVIDKVE